MAIKLFEILIGDTKIYVNPAKIRFLRPATAQKTAIIFDNDHTIIVDEPIADLAMRLQHG